MNWSKLALFLISILLACLMHAGIIETKLTVICVCIIIALMQLKEFTVEGYSDSGGCSVDCEAMSNIASIYNDDQVILPNVSVSGDLSVTGSAGDLSVGNLSVTSTATIDGVLTTNDEIKGQKMISAPGIGVTVSNGNYTADSRPIISTFNESNNDYSGGLYQDTINGGTTALGIAGQKYIYLKQANTGNYIYTYGGEVHGSNGTVSCCS